MPGLNGTASYSNPPLQSPIRSLYKCREDQICNERAVVLVEHRTAQRKDWKFGHMGFKTGIVGLPNVGKSTLFNALTRTAAAQAENYPFCTIEPNIGDVAVPEPRLQKLAQIAQSQEIIPARMQFVDIAGLVAGAAKGEGLGNQFLANIREVDCVAYVLRCFEDENITHVEGRIDPLADFETVETELMLADLESLEKRADPLHKKANAGDKDAKQTLRLINIALDLLRDGKPAREASIASEDAKDWHMLQLLTQKPAMFIANIDENSLPDGNVYSGKVEEFALQQQAPSVVICAKIEEELAQLDDNDRVEFLADLGLEAPGLDRLIRVGYERLGLQTYFTAGPKETRAWTIRQGMEAPKAAGVIHTDFERGFIRAETIAYDDYIALNGEQGAKEAGKMRQEGKDYIVQDGDVMHFRFNV